MATPEVKFFQRVTEASSPTGQDLANEIAVDVRSGCFEYCDGFPAEATESYKALLSKTGVEIDNITKGKGDVDNQDVILKKAAQYADRSANMYRVVRSECPGGYSQFETDEELEDDNFEPIQKACPIAEKLVAAFNQPPATREQSNGE